MNIIDKLYLGITRRCNMACSHCYRGDAEDLDMPNNVIDAALAPFAGGKIDVLHLCGGEPTLNVPGIKYVLTRCRELKITVSGITVEINGKTVPDAFLDAMEDWHRYCARFNTNDPQPVHIYISKDRFHEPIPEENVRLLCSQKNLSVEMLDDFESDGSDVINMGRAQAMDLPNKDKTFNYYAPDTNPSGMDQNATGGLTIWSGQIDGFYVSAKGPVYASPFLEYDIPSLALCNVLFSENWLEDIPSGVEDVFGEDDCIHLTPEMYATLHRYRHLPDVVKLGF